MVAKRRPQREWNDYWRPEPRPNDPPKPLPVLIRPEDTKTWISPRKRRAAVRQSVPASTQTPPGYDTRRHCKHCWAVIKPPYTLCYRCYSKYDGDPSAQKRIRNSWRND